MCARMHCSLCNHRFIQFSIWFESSRRKIRKRFGYFFFSLLYPYSKSSSEFFLSSSNFACWILIDSFTFNRQKNGVFFNSISSVFVPLNRLGNPDSVHPKFKIKQINSYAFAMNPRNVYFDFGVIFACCRNILIYYPIG